MKRAKSLNLVITILLVSVIAMFASCNQNASREFIANGGFVEHEVMLGEPLSVVGSVVAPASDASVERKLIKEGQLTFETKDLLHTGASSTPLSESIKPIFRRRRKTNTVIDSKIRSSSGCLSTSLISSYVMP